MRSQLHGVSEVAAEPFHGPTRPVRALLPERHRGAPNPGPLPCHGPSFLSLAFNTPRRTRNNDTAFYNHVLPSCVLLTQGSGAHKRSLADAGPSEPTMAGGGPMGKLLSSHLVGGSSGLTMSPEPS